jgi:hypothetical protein
MPILLVQVFPRISKPYGDGADVGGGGKMTAAQTLGSMHNN